MKSLSMILLVCLTMLLLLTSCTTHTNRTRVVLIPDPNGKVGKIFIKNEGGSQIIDKAGYMSEIRDAANPPNSAVAMDEKEINRIFGAALAALPEQPVTDRLYFKDGTTNLTEASLKDVASIQAAIDSRQSEDISVIGHADKTGTKEKNYILSRSRALMVKKIIVRKGVNPATIDIDYHGEANPLIKTPDGVSEPRNRRVEVTIR